MKPGLDWLYDPSFHLIALTTTLMGMVLTYNSRAWWSPGNKVMGHPPGCRACSACPPEVAAARDAYLIRTGSIQDPTAVE